MKVAQGPSAHPPGPVRSASRRGSATYPCTCGTSWEGAALRFDGGGNGGGACFPVDPPPTGRHFASVLFPSPARPGVASDAPRGLCRCHLRDPARIPAKGRSTLSPASRARWLELRSGSGKVADAPSRIPLDGVPSPVQASQEASQATNRQGIPSPVAPRQMASSIDGQQPSSRILPAKTALKGAQPEKVLLAVPRPSPSSVPTKALFQPCQGRSGKGVPRRGTEPPPTRVTKRPFVLQSGGYRGVQGTLCSQHCHSGPLEHQLQELWKKQRGQQVQGVGRPPPPPSPWRLVCASWSMTDLDKTLWALCAREAQC